MPQAVHTIRNGEPFLLQAYVQASGILDFKMNSNNIVGFNILQDNSILLGPGTDNLGIFYSSNVSENEYSMVTKSMRTGILNDKTTGENMVIEVFYTNSVSSTFVIQ